MPIGRRLVRWKQRAEVKSQTILQACFSDMLDTGDRGKVVDFHWNSIDPWTLVSVSDDCSSSAGGGTLQIWRIIDLLYRPEEEVLAELDEFRSNVAACSPTPTKDVNHSA
ncbi:WD-40 repeat-containing protein MSI4-like isoform X1 [Silene latifolia]|uniref:WD-40 repeat-containing protein MSI4-like isoform X1 n=1 Tax=Silene latifolia TaxID=37657 RepID=UPI003D778B6A